MKKYPYGLTLSAVCEAIDAYRDHEDDVPEAGMVAAFEILLAAMDKPETALTAQPVKLPPRRSMLTREEIDQDYVTCMAISVEDAIAAIRAAGYEVQE